MKNEKTKKEAQNFIFHFLLSPILTTTKNEIPARKVWGYNKVMINPFLLFYIYFLLLTKHSFLEFLLVLVPIFHNQSLHC